MFGMSAINDNRGLEAAAQGWITLPFIDLAVIMGLLHRGPSSAEELLPHLSEWCVRPVRMADLQSAITRMLDQDWLCFDGEGDLRPTPAVYEPAMRLSSAYERMWQSTTPPGADPNQLSIDSDWRRI